MSIRLLCAYIFMFGITTIGTLDAQEKNDALLSDSLPSTDSVAIAKGNVFQRFIKYFDDSNKVKEEKKLDISFIGGPHYSGDSKFGVGLVASGLYRIDKEDKSLSPSNVSLYSDFTTAGFYVVGIEGNTIFPKGKYRLDGDVYFASKRYKFWGVGYDKARYGDNTKYRSQEIKMKFDFLTRIAPNTYAGITGTYHNVKARSIDDPFYFEDLDVNTAALGGGALISYDSRDFIPNPYKGMYIKLEHNIFPAWAGNKHVFNRTEFIFRTYNQVWKGGVLAYDLQGLFNTKHTPWTMIARMGNSHQMRGYYGGQYIDNNLIQTQLELRQHIWRRNSAVVWVGAGNIFPSFNHYDWGKTMPTYGVGYRWEFKKRVNVRLDYGIGKGESSFYFSINEAF